MRLAALAGTAVLVAAGCGGERPGVPASAEAGAPPADSLVARGAGGVELWFTLARPDTGGGAACVDRALEIRRDGRRIPVPLLYTGSAPELLNDTIARARLSTRCRPGDAYLVDLRTGHPVRERP